MKSGFDKTDLRQLLKQDRISLTETDRQVANARICALSGHLCSTLQAEYDKGIACSDTREANRGRPFTVALYAPTQGEVDLSPLFGQFRDAGCRTLYPRVRANGHMEMHEVTQWSELERGAYDILAPTLATQVIPPTEVDVIFTPGLAFTKEGARLGYGGGYYDRYFSRCADVTIAVGVAYERQLRDVLPVMPHDYSMNYVITEQGVTQCSRMG